MVPLTFHWYEGVVPPFVGVAVKVTDVPEQTGFAEGEIEMFTGRPGLIVTDDVAVTTGQPLKAAMVLEIGRAHV